MSDKDDVGRERGTVVAVSRSQHHGFSKAPRASIVLMAGLGVEGDAHAGTPVQHLYRIKLDPTAPNLAQFDRAADGTLIRKAGIMGVVIEGGRIAPGDAIEVELPDEPHYPLEVV